MNFKETRVYNKRNQGATQHNLAFLLQELPSLQRAIALDRTGTYKNAWNAITRLWQKDGLRYYDRVGNEHDSQSFMAAVTVISAFLLEAQGEAS